MSAGGGLGSSALIVRWPGLPRRTLRLVGTGGLPMSGWIDRDDVLHVDSVLGLHEQPRPIHGRRGDDRERLLALEPEPNDVLLQGPTTFLEAEPTWVSSGKNMRFSRRKDPLKSFAAAHGSTQPGSSSDFGFQTRHSPGVAFSEPRTDGGSSKEKIFQAKRGLSLMSLGFPISRIWKSPALKNLGSPPSRPVT